MAKVEVSYYLSEKGQKADLLAGGDGKPMKVIVVDPTDKDNYALAVELGSISGEGNVSVPFYNWWHGKDVKRKDAPPPLADLLTEAKALRDQAAAEKAAEEAECLAKCWAAVRERKTDTKHRSGRFIAEEHPDKPSLHWGTSDWQYPLLPYSAPAEVKDSPELAAFQAELDARNQALEGKLKAEALDEYNRQQAAKRQEEEAAEARREAKRQEKAARGLAAEDCLIRVEEGALCNVPIWCGKSDAKNWLALIKLAPDQPGGLGRTFAEKAKGEWYYMAPAWVPGDPVEFGGDDYSASSKRKRRVTRSRWYGFVVRADDKEVVLRQCATGKAAIKAGMALASGRAGERAAEDIMAADAE